MNQEQQEVYEALGARSLYPQPRMQALFDTLSVYKSTIDELYLKEHAALDDGDRVEADRCRDLMNTVWEAVYKIEIRIHEALQWIENK